MPGLLYFFVETGFHHVAQAGLKLLGSGNPPASASQIAGITDVSHHLYLFISLYLSLFLSGILLWGKPAAVLCGLPEERCPPERNDISAQQHGGPESCYQPHECAWKQVEPS